MPQLFYWHPIFHHYYLCKLFEYHQNEMICISDNSIILNINNMTDTHYTKYERFIEFKLKIVLNN